MPSAAWNPRTSRRSTRRHGHFTPLLAGAKDDEATAEYQHGVLTIRTPVLERKTGIITVPVREPLRAGTR